jgi:hypothetical protein
MSSAAVEVIAVILAILSVTSLMDIRRASHKRLVDVTDYLIPTKQKCSV